MRAELQKRCDLLFDNKEAIKQVFKWESGMMHLAASCIFTGQEKRVHVEQLKECEEILKAHTGLLSDFRAHVKQALVCKMALSENPERYFEQVKACYELLKQKRIFGSEYLILAAMTICDHIGDADPSEAVERTREIYARMKEEHPWLTSDEDFPFAAMLAVSGLDVDPLIDEMETCYAILKKKFHDSNAVQSLSHILALNGAPAEEKCQMIMDIFDALKANKHKYSKSMGLASLGVLTMLDVPVNEIADEIAEADDYLKGFKGFGDFVLGSEQRRMYAAQMVMDSYQKHMKTAVDAIVTNMVAYMIAIEVCMIIMMASVTTTTANN